MAWTTLYHQKSGTKTWRQSNERKIVSNTWISKIHSKKARELEDKVSSEEHETYRSGVGTLRYLTKHSRPDICNPVRELSKTMDAPVPVHLKEMYKVIRYVLSTREQGLKFELRKDIKKWALKTLSDSGFVSDKETRISVFGYIIYFCQIPIAWRSKGMKVLCCQQQKQNT